MMASPDEIDCPFRDHHPRLEANVEEIERQVEEVARRMGVMEDAMRDAIGERVVDLKDFTRELSTLHEKINTAIAGLADVRGRLIVFGLIATMGGTAGGAIAMFLMSNLFAHIAK